jgi:hypothetical protein
MKPAQRQELLQNLADTIARRGLAAPTRLALDVLTPIGFLASQAALFMRPLMPLGRWRDYVIALEDEASWKVLQRLIAQRDS